MRRIALVVLLLVGTTAAWPSDAGASWIDRSYFALLQAAHDALVVRVDTTGGPRFGEWAQVSVEQRLKGAVGRDTLRLPFEYGQWPSLGWKGYLQSTSTAIPRSFETGQRLLVLVVRRPLPGTTAAGNPLQAETRYRVYPYPSNAVFDLQETAEPILWASRQLLEAGRAPTDQSAAAALRPLVASSDPRIRRFGYEAAQELAPAPLAPALLERFRSETDPGLREAVTRSLSRLPVSRLPGSSVTRALLDAASEYRPALRALARRRDTARAAPIMQMYRAQADTATEGRIRGLLSALEPHLTPQHAPRLIQWYDQADTAGHRQALLSTIAATRSTQAVDLLGDVLATAPEPAMRSEAARVVRRDSLRQLVPRLLVRLREETNPRVRRLVAEALSGFDGPEVTAALLEVGPRFPPALLALKQRRDTSLAAPLIDIYDAVADTAGRQRRDAILSALEAHLRPRHARTVVRWYRSTSSERRRAALLGLAGRLKTPVSDSLLASALSEDAPKRLRLLAADLTRKHGTRRPDALASVVRRQGDSDVRRAALQALAATGGTGFADAMVDHAPPPCAPPPSRQGLSGLWASFAEWLGAGEKRPTWAPEVLDALRKAGQAAAPDEKAPAVRAAARYLTCDRFPAVRLVAARTLFGIDPQAAAPTLRAHLAEEPSRRVRREIEHLLWVAGSL